MKKKLYNSKDEEYKHVIKLLKELPKEKALDNFEYNLSVKIKNINFGLKTSEKSFFSFRKIIAPAFGAALGSVVLFFTVFNNTDTLENPFQIKPLLRSEMSGSFINSPKIVKSFGLSGKISESDVFVKEIENKSSYADVEPSKVNNVNLLTQSEKKKGNYPFDINKSTNLDEVIGQKSKNKINYRASLTSRGNSSTFFDGFYIRDEVDKKYVETLKARMDSLKLVMGKRKK